VKFITSHENHMVYFQISCTLFHIFLYFFQWTKSITGFNTMEKKMKHDINFVSDFKNTRESSALFINNLMFMGPCIILIVE